MIGSAEITYDNEDVCQIIRKDLVDKFGNRELANYNLYLPGVIRPQAVIKELPNPDVKVTSVEEQIKEMGILPKPSVSRRDDSVSADIIGGGAPVSSSFYVGQDKLVISGGPVEYSDLGPADSYGHWYNIIVGFPVGFDYAEDQIISYVVNGVPKAYVLDASDIEAGVLTFMADAKFTTVDYVINWDDAYAPEKISVVCNASLAEKAIKKIPAFPTEPKFEFIYPKDAVVDSEVQVYVNLDCGKR